MADYEDSYFANIPFETSSQFFDASRRTGYRDYGSTNHGSTNYGSTNYDQQPEFGQNYKKYNHGYGTSDDYNSMENFKKRTNRAAMVRNIESYYDDEYIPQYTEDLKYEIRELKLQHRYMMFFVFIIVMFLIFGKQLPEISKATLSQL
jgi:hypothetical protein